MSFDASTSILTSDGWIPVPALTLEHKVAQFATEDATLVGFEPALDIQAKPFDGCVLNLDGFLISRDTYLYASLSHNPLRRYTPSFELYRADMQMAGRYAGKQVWQAPMRIRRAGMGTRLRQQRFAPFDKLPPVELARLVGFSIGDGDVKSNSKDKLRFQLRRVRKTNYLAGICDKLKLFLATRRKQYFHIKYPGIGRWFFDNIYVPNMPHKTKTLPPILLECSQSVLEALLDGLRNSDGEVINPSANRWLYSTMSLPLAEMVQAVGVVAGVPFSCNINRCYRLSSLISHHLPHVNDARTRNHITEVPYEGMLYDVQTASRVISIRRNYRTMLVGTNPVAATGRKDILDGNLAAPKAETETIELPDTGSKLVEVGGEIFNVEALVDDFNEQLGIHEVDDEPGTSEEFGG